MQRRYKAFISYSWADKEWGSWLHQSLETYRTPKALVGSETPLGPAPARLHPIFKDREEEAAGHGIGAAIEAAMAQSDFLIVICSPRSAKSQWVNREVAWFKKHKSKERILALVVEGEPGASFTPGREAEECFPATLLCAVDDNLQPTDEREDVPLAADARKEGDGKRGAKLKLAAALLGVGLDVLVKRDERRRAIRRRVVTGGLAASVAVLSGLTLFAFDQRNAARAAQAEAEESLINALAQYDQAEGLVEFMIDDLRQKLQQEVQLKVLADIAKRAQDYYQTQITLRIDDNALGRRARVLDLLSSLEHDLGNLDTSLILAKESVASSTQLLARDPESPDRLIELAHSVQRLGNLSYQRGDLELAEAQMQQAVELTARLVSLDGKNIEWQAEKASALANAGIIQLRNNNVVDAIESLRDAAAIKRAAIDSDQNRWQAQYDLGVTLSWLAIAMKRAGRNEEAHRILDEEASVLSSMRSANPDDAYVQLRHVRNLTLRADLMRHAGELASAFELASEAARLAEDVRGKDPEDNWALENAAQSRISLGQVAMAMGNLDLASASADITQKLMASLLVADPERIMWSGVYLGEARILGAQSEAMKAPDIDGCRTALEPMVAESERLRALNRGAPADVELARAAAAALMLSGDHAFAGNDVEEAKTRWAKGAALLAPLSQGGTNRERATEDLIQQLTHRQKTDLNDVIETVCRV